MTPVAAIALAAVAVLSGSPAAAGDAQSAAKAREVLQQAAAALSGHDTFLLEGALTYRGEFDGDSEVMDTDYTLAFQRPDTVSVHALNREFEVYFYGDGKELTRYIPEFKQYVTEADESAPQKIVEESGFELITPALKVLAQLVRADPFDAEFPAEDLAYLRQDTWKDFSCDVVRFRVGDYAYDLWVEQAPARLIRRIEPDMTALEEAYGQEYGMDFDFQVAAELTTWKLGADVAKDIAFSPPEDVEKVAAFQAPRPETPADRLVGEAAPDFTLPLLDGGEVTLSEQTGNIVILDFWATWCGPCRIAMPVLEEVSREFADQGVKLFGVNLQEGPDQINAYLENQGLENLTVALDRDASVAERYRVEGIPQTVIVGPDGVIKIVHVGLWTMPTAQPAETPEEQEQQIHEALAGALRDELRGLLEN